MTARVESFEIACDESGWEGTNLAAANSDVIAYASVQLSIDGAAEVIRSLQGLSGQRSYEYKASHLIRANGGTGLAAFLGRSGPVYGQARVHLTHKSCFILGRILDLVVAGAVDAATVGLRPDQRVAAAAVRLCQAGPARFGPEPWQAFLAAANVVLRADRRGLVQEPVDAFFDVLQEFGGDALFDELRDRRPEAYAARARLLADQVRHPVLDPASRWCGGVGPPALRPGSDPTDPSTIHSGW
jgi:hypothetical protein